MAPVHHRACSNVSILACEGPLIGDKAKQALIGAGYRSAADILSNPRGLAEVPGIGPMKASTLELWARDVDARLVAQEAEQLRRNKVLAESERVRSEARARAEADREWRDAYQAEVDQSWAGLSPRMRRQAFLTVLAIVVWVLGPFVFVRALRLRSESPQRAPTRGMGPGTLWLLGFLAVVATVAAGWAIAVVLGAAATAPPASELDPRQPWYAIAVVVLVASTLLVPAAAMWAWRRSLAACAGRLTLDRADQNGGSDRMEER